MQRPVPSRLVSFAARIVRLLDSDDPDVFLDADDAVQSRAAVGGRTGKDAFFITYYATRKETWSVALDERTLRRLGAGVLSTVEADVFATTKAASPSRRRRGDAFACWGEDEGQRALLTSEQDVHELLVWLGRESRQREGGVAAALLGSTFGDLVYLALAADDVAYLGVVFASGDRLSLEGDAAQVEPRPATFPLLPDPVPLTHGDYVPLASMRDALMGLVLRGSKDRRLRWTAAMHSALLFELPLIATERGFTVPLSTRFPPLAASGLHAQGSKTAHGQRQAPASLAAALVAALVARNAIELTGKRGEAALRDRIAELIEGREQGKPLALWATLMSDPNVADVFVDEPELDLLCADLAP